MGRWGRCDYRELKKLDERLQQLSEVDMDRLCRDAAKKIAQILLNKVKKRTPVGVAPKFDGPKTVKVKGASGKSRTFLTRSGAIREQYWAGYRGGSLRDAWTILPIEKHGDLIDEETGENFSYESSIDEQTYNKIKLAYNNEKTGKRELFIAQDGTKMNQWGVLQYFEEVQTKTGASAKADALLKLYDQKTRKLTIQNAFGDVRVRAGSAVVVALNLGDIVTNNYMVVNKVTHTFRGDEHMMELDLIGGEFIA